MKQRFLSLAVAGVVLGVVQALVETLAMAWLYRDLLLTPYRFFPTHSYDAFTKVWFILADHFSLPLLLQNFVGQGFLAKFAIAPELIAINVAMAMLLALILTPVAGLLGVNERSGVRRSVWLLAAVCVAVHAVAWALVFQAPESVTASKLLRSVGRDVLQGGGAEAGLILLVSTLLASLVISRRSATAAGLALGAAMLCATSLGEVGDAMAKVEPSAAVAAASPAKGYNVILVSIDSLRADHLGAYGYERETSPAMDAIAANGVLFRNSISTTSWTLPSHMSLLTARSLLGHGVVSDDRSLSGSVPTVAESFQEGGYETHAIVSAPYLDSRYGFARGFDHYDDRTIYFETNEDSYRSVTAPELIAAAGKYLAQPRQNPFFLFLHFWDVHYDYAPGPPYDTMFDPDYSGTVDGNNFYFDSAINKDMNPRDLEHLIALYDGEIRLVDDHLAILKEELKRLGIEKNTILAVVADHGDEFFEHGNKGHHRTLYEEVIHTPFLFEVPGGKPSAREVERETSLIDVAPTLLGLVGLGKPNGAEGRDFSGLYTGAALPEDKPVYAELYRTGTGNVQAAQIDGRHKVIHHFQQRWLESYDLAGDPGEQAALALSGEVTRPQVSRLREWIDGRWDRFDKRIRTEGIEPVVLDERATEQLRSLGYLQ